MSQDQALATRKPESLVEVESIDQLDRIQEAVFGATMTSAEGAAAMLYIIKPKGRDGKPPEGRPIVGANADFVIQAVRRFNAASKRTKTPVQLESLGQPPIVQDFVRGGRPWVRVITGAVDKISGEITYGIKEAPADSHHTVTLLHTKALRRAFEIHPAYNRRRMSGAIRAFLRALKLDPKDFIIAGEGQSNEWAPYFAAARKAGVTGEELRQYVREQTGRGLSEILTQEQAAAAAAALDERIDKAPDPAVGSIGAAPPAEGFPSAPILPPAGPLSAEETAALSEEILKAASLKDLEAITERINALKPRLTDEQQRRLHEDWTIRRDEMLPRDGAREEATV